MTKYLKLIQVFVKATSGTILQLY